MNPVGQCIVPESAASLRDVVPVRVVIVARGPFTVMPPAPLLAESSRPGWLIKPHGPPEIAKLPDGTERWVQHYRLEAFAAGESIALQFSPFQVAIANEAAVSVPIPSRFVNVMAQNTGSEVRPVTGHEMVPSVAADERSILLPVMALTAILLMTILLLLWWWRKPKALPLRSARELARKQLLEAEGCQDSRDFAGVVSRTIRGYLEAETLLPATRQTIAELRPAASPAVIDLLERCDTSMFSGHGNSTGERERLLATARQIVEEADLRCLSSSRT